MTSNNNPNSGSEHWLLRVPTALYWTVLAVLVLCLVFTYDRQGVKTIRTLTTSAETAEATGKHVEAIAAYKSAYANNRATNRKKSELALAIAGIYFEKLNNPELAAEWYTLAKRHYPQILRKPEQAALLNDRIRAGKADEEKKSAFALFVPAPDSDNDGEVVATFDGGMIYRGAFERGRNADAQTSAALAEFVDRELIFHVAVEDGYLDRPDVAAQLYDAQRDAVVDAYLRDKERTEPQPLREQLNVKTFE